MDINDPPVPTGEVMVFLTKEEAELFCDPVWAEYHNEEIIARRLPAASTLDTSGKWITVRYQKPMFYRNRWVVEVNGRVNDMQGRRVDLPTVASLENSPDEVVRSKRAVGATSVARPRSVMIDVSGKIPAKDVP